MTIPDILIIIGVIVYLAVGALFNGLLLEDWQAFDFLLMLFWPLVVVFVVVIIVPLYIIQWFYTLGKNIKKGVSK